MNYTASITYSFLSLFAPFTRRKNSSLFLIHIGQIRLVMGVFLWLSEVLPLVSEVCDAYQEIPDWEERAAPTKLQHKGREKRPLPL